jgi:DNA-binding CsgD family transcriptional regulator
LSAGNGETASRVIVIGMTSTQTATRLHTLTARAHGRIAADAEVPVAAVVRMPRPSDTGRMDGYTLPSPEASPLQSPRLSQREREVLVMWLKQESKTEVGATLYITASTVRTHLQRIREKYAAVGRPAATKLALGIRAIQDGLVDVNDL